ncbi:hypothetical protein [Lacticaseibacillus saniviri]
MEDEYSIAKYFNADAIIQSLQQHRKEVAGLSNSTLCGTVMYDVDRIHMYAPRVDTLVIDMLMRCEAIDRRIQRWKMRKRVFNQYLTTLTVEQITTLLNGTASADLIDAVQLELFEIETYVAYHFGERPPERENDINPDAAAAMNDMLAFLEVG